MRRLRNFLALPATEKALALEAAAELAAATLLLAMLPFRHVARRLEGASPPPRSGIDPALLRPIGRAVARAARHLPWHPLCLPQTMAARAMLRRRGIPSTLHFGMALKGEERTMKAHAWLTAGTAGVIGTPAEGEFTVLARYTG